MRKDYLAGVFDARGSVFLVNGRYPKIRLTTRSKVLAEWMLEEFGGAIYEWNGTYDWHVSRRDLLIETISLLKNLVIFKRDILKIAEEILKAAPLRVDHLVEKFKTTPSCCE